MKYFFLTLCLWLMLGATQAQFLSDSQKAEARALTSVKEKAEWVSQAMTARYELNHDQANVVKMAFLQRSQGALTAAAFRQTVQAALTPEQARQYKADTEQYQKAQQRNQAVAKSLGNKQGAGAAREDEWSEILP